MHDLAAIPRPDKPVPKEWYPSPAQNRMLEAAQELGVERDISSMLAAANVPRETFYRWLKKNPGFRAAWENIWLSTLKRHFPSVTKAILSSAILGDIKAARLAADLLGYITNKNELTGPDGGPLVVRLGPELQEWAK